MQACNICVVHCGCLEQFSRYCSFKHSRCLHEFVRLCDQSCSHWQRGGKLFHFVLACMADYGLCRPCQCHFYKRHLKYYQLQVLKHYLQWWQSSRWLATGSYHRWLHHRCLDHCCTRFLRLALDYGCYVGSSLRLAQQVEFLSFSAGAWLRMLRWFKRLPRKWVFQPKCPNCPKRSFDTSH